MLDFFFLRKSCRLWDNVEKYRKPVRSQMTLQYDACAVHIGWLKLHAPTHNCFTTATIVMRTHLNVTFILTLLALFLFLCARETIRLSRHILCALSGPLLSSFQLVDPFIIPGMWQVQIGSQPFDFILSCERV